MLKKALISCLTESSYHVVYHMNFHITQNVTVYITLHIIPFVV